MTATPHRAPLTLLIALLLTLILPFDRAPGRAAAGDEEPGGQGSAVWPLSPQPTVAAGFSPPAAPWASGHRGVDLRGTAGRPVHAALAGRVSFIGRIAGRGVVVVDHGATRTTYEPVTATLARGAQVVAGTVIGRLELLGSHCHPTACLHWGLIRSDDVYLDPLGLLNHPPIRLLPFSGAWMSLLVGGPQPFVGDVGVQLGGGQRGMTEGLLDTP
ncbi:M23 family metallopeptidase [Nocardioides sp. Bht2]|uniref:M23 family metallopeptidase n=1 Tax=Nocardioides sp. Bht2 TaxID=3392297 RepID=UPI0039B6375A